MRQPSTVVNRKYVSDLYRITREFAHTEMLFAMRVLSRIMELKCFNDYASDKRRCDSIELYYLGNRNSCVAFISRISFYSIELEPSD